MAALAKASESQCERFTHISSDFGSHAGSTVNNRKITIADPSFYHNTTALLFHRPVFSWYSFEAVLFFFYSRKGLALSGIL